MIQAKEDEILTPCSYQDDAPNELGRNISPPNKICDRKLSILGLIGWAMNNVNDLVFRNPETCAVCVELSVGEERMRID
jgi:hypothetical protein